MSLVLVPHPAEVPAGYPRAYERIIVLADGRSLAVRPIVPADAPQLGEAIAHADPDTLRRRFLGGPPHVTSRLLDHLVTVDYRRRFALVAVDAVSHSGVAVARYESAGDKVAEVAVAVDPAWRRVGVATALVELLAEAALDRGIDTFGAYYLAENVPVAALLRHAGAAGRRHIHQGFAEVSVALDRDDVAAAVRDLDARPWSD